MIRAVLYLVGALVVGVVWTFGYGYAQIEGWGRGPIAPRGDAGAFLAAATEMAQDHPGNLALVLIEDGAVVGEHYQSVGAPVDGDTLFQVASLSKWITAWGVMTLVEDGRLDLDAPVSTYLTRWTLPESEFDTDAVTVRRLLAHAAGLTDGLGYGGFAPGDAVQPLEASLTQASDASHGDGRTVVGAEPGRTWRYSGGGYTLLQLLIEEVTGEGFNAYMTRAVFEPLGMAGSTFVLDHADRARVATFYDVDGSEAVHYSFTALAAASLYTSANDLTKLVAAHHAGPNGAPAGRGVLSPDTLAAMREPTSFTSGFAIWGLGAILYAPNGAGSFVVGHDGGNDPAINTTVRVDPATGDGIVVLETGDLDLATRVGGAWVTWKTGERDVIAIGLGMGETLMVIAIGWLVILVGAIALAIARRRRRA